MIISDINKLESFNRSVFRNSPLFDLGYDEFDDLSDDEEDNNIAHAGARDAMNEPVLVKEQTYYHSVGFVFSNRNLPSRFGDGTFPVWYGSVDEVTTYRETCFHWLNSAINDIAISMDFVCKRSIFNVDCNGLLVDIRSLTSKYPELIDPNLESYSITQPFSKKIHDQGQSGLFAKSARSDKGENIVIYNEETLSNAAHVKDIQYLYQPNRDSVSVIDLSTQIEIIKI